LSDRAKKAPPHGGAFFLSIGHTLMTVDTVEELRAELRECLFTPAERKALEAELADLIRQRNEALVDEEERGRKVPRLATYGATAPLIH
jgi:hypothetical protein